MTKKLTALLLALFLFGQSQLAFADDNTYGIPVEWFACKTSDDCGKVKNPCGYVITAINKTYAGDAFNLICYNRPDHAAACLAGCVQTKPMGKDLTEAFCENGQCLIRTLKPREKMPTATPETPR